jgi:AcrR family transcriptional regulator
MRVAAAMRASFNDRMIVRDVVFVANCATMATPTPARSAKAGKAAAASTADDSRAPRKRDAEVLEAAARVFHERGYGNASVQDIADAVGILKGSLYHYIDTKEDLLYRLLEGVHEDVQGILEQVEAAPGLAPLERLHLYVSRQVEFNVRNLTRISVYYHDVERLSPERRDAIYTLRRVHEKFVMRLIGEAQERGEIDADQDPRLLANCIFATIIWVYRWYQPRGRFRPADVARTSADFAIRGVCGEIPGAVADGPSALTPAS